MTKRFQVGIDTLLRRHRDWLAGRRVGLLSHTAAVDVTGSTSAATLWHAPDIRLTCLMAPEHGFFGRAAAGRHCRTVKHPTWGIPIYSLYGARRTPTDAMLKQVDVVVFDLQDIGARAYTYVSTLALLLRAAGAAQKPVIVADRPIPLPDVVDGPVPAARCHSFVAAIDAPLCYGMTPGETATWLTRAEHLDVELRVARMRGYRRESERPGGAPPWLQPSPAMQSWESAACFPITVCMEGIGALDHGRRTNLPFQVFGTTWTHGEDLASALNACALKGVRFHPHAYMPDPHVPAKRPIDGVRITVTDARRVRPALTAVTILHTLQQLYGARRLWAPATARPAFFDKLWGTDRVRTMLRGGAAPDTIAATWRGPLRRFRCARADNLLYAHKGGAR